MSQFGAAEQLFDCISTPDQALGWRTICTLTVTNSGTVVASIALLGNYIAGSTDFAAGSDGQGGTTITDPPVIAAADQAGFLMVPRQAANITLLGQYMAAQFNLANDGHGGTLVTDPPINVATDQQLFLTQPQKG